ncbi:MAG: hypothetical protein CFH22_00741 [Alphaproteobacteria bacterium MarineAlpha5_Bin12]|nr:hypothetical protein [Pelagibacteraceae bacterium]PPR41327.1 MAG: hypothetical protein CFH22_00741 [Alphaproteobacteria bacterium MarineAlpha5_Bin12]|tara:strand:+ start:9494 stop:9754 length:261 start_codon:yes stop_codon:yes gene_type:complete
MNRIERIKKILFADFEPSRLDLKDHSFKHSGHNNFDGTGMTHLYLQIKSDKFKGKKLIEIHKMINSSIKIEYENGLHSLEIKIINY